MKVLTEQECAAVSGGVTWDENTCQGAVTIGGIVIGAGLGGWGGAALGGFAGSWLGDNFCTYFV